MSKLNFIKDFSSYRENLLMIPLGGTNEIGMNITLYHYLGKWIVIDCGTCFAHNIPGVKMLFPDTKMLTKIKKDILGLFITHCHEDHLGAVNYLLEQVKCPIYATAFTANFLKKKFRDLNDNRGTKINIIETDSKIDLHPFKLEFSSLAHSALEMQSILVKTDVGDVLHTGDWKFDSETLIGPAQNYDALKKYGKLGIAALVCDSTNVMSSEKSKSEKELKENLTKLIKREKNLVVVTTFGSNFCRLYSLFVAAKKADRKVVVAGKSMKRIIEIAKTSNYFEGVNGDVFAELISDREMKQYPRSKLLVIAAGCQGDSNSALYSIVYGGNSITLQEKDTVIFSSKIIPGNEKDIGAIINKLILNNVNVITEADEFVHVSGHPFIGDLEKMYSILGPKFSIPVHGEPIHLKKHAQLASRLGAIPVVPTNGTVINISNQNTQIVGKVHSGYIALDGNDFIHTDSPIIETRKAISYAGAVIVTVILDTKHGKFIKIPSIAFPGCLDKKTDTKLINKIKNGVSIIIENNFHNLDTMSSKIYAHVRKIIKGDTGKKPYIEVNVDNVNL